MATLAADKATLAARETDLKLLTEAVEAREVRPYHPN
jgi:hypothetical protein